MDPPNSFQLKYQHDSHTLTNLSSGRPGSMSIRAYCQRHPTTRCSMRLLLERCFYRSFTYSFDSGNEHDFLIHRDTPRRRARDSPNSHYQSTQQPLDTALLSAGGRRFIGIECISRCRIPRSNPLRIPCQIISSMIYTARLDQP